MGGMGGYFPAARAGFSAAPHASITLAAMRR
jgi:hypothetical protein